MRENWQIKKLGEVCTIERGGSPRPISEYITDSPSGLNWIKIGDAKEGSKYINSTKEKIKPEGLKSTRLVHKGDFILSNSMSFGKPYILGLDGCIHDGWLVIHDNNCTFEKSYLYYMLGNPNMYTKFKRLAVGGVVNNLNCEIVRNVFVPIPPLEEQERIVAELDLLTGVIEKQKAQLKELDNLAQSIFYDMFGDPVENEKGWEECIFKDAFKLKSGDNLVEKNFREGQYPVYGGNGISGYHNKFNKDGQFILIGRVGAYCGNVRYVQGHFWLTDNAFQASFDKEIFDYEYSCMLLNLIDLHQYANHAAQPVISNVGLRDIKIIIPPLQLQQQFAEKIEAIEHQKTLIKKSIEETQKLFDYTMDKYFG